VKIDEILLPIAPQLPRRDLLLCTSPRRDSLLPRQRERPKRRHMQISQRDNHHNPKMTNKMVICRKVIIWRYRNDGI